MSLAEQALETIDGHVRSSRICAHPLMVAWADGQLSRDDLRSFASQYYHQVDSIPRYISSVHACTEDPTIRCDLTRLLYSYEGTSPTAADHWLQLCASLGLFSDTVRASDPNPDTHSCIDDFFHICRDGVVPGLAVLHANARLLPELSRLQLSGLTDHYDMATGPAREYYEVTAHASTEHAALLRDLLTRAIGDSEHLIHEAVAASAHADTALCRLFDGVTPGNIAVKS